MRKLYHLLSLVTIVLIAIFLSACSESAENEHLPEYCRTYSGFMDTASPDLYELIGGTDERNYLTDISVNQLTFEVYEEDREIDLDGIQCFQNLTSLTLEGPAFKDISEISALKNIQQISLINTNVVSISSFRNLSKVNSLTISNTKTLQSVDGVEEMTKLTYLDLSDNGIVNITGLNNLVNLESLYLNNNEITYFPSINLLKDLETLDVSNNNIIQLGEDLSGLSNLKYFNASENEICDLSTLDDLTSLITLDLSFNDLGCEGDSPDFSSLEGATGLLELHLNDNGLTSISDLATRTLPLEELYIQNNELTDITPISGFTSLEVLEVYNNQIVDINNLSGMANITRIDLSDNQITDFSDLRSIPDLELIDLSNNAITFIPDISDSWPSLREIDLSTNALTDTSGVEGHANLRTLILNNNGLETLSGISNLPLFEDLVLFQEVPDGELPEDFVFDVNPNAIRVIDNSYNNVPNFVLTDTGTLDFGYQLEPNGEIYGSFNNIEVSVVDFEDWGISVIDEFSFTSEDITGINIRNNNITDISFILGNEALTSVFLSDNPISNLTILNGTDSDDLDNLEQIEARNISGVNHLDGAFVDLPDLSVINLENTRIDSITGSFNDLDELTDLTIEGNFITFIDDSFNNIFAVTNPNNDIIFTQGLIYSITDSFNYGNYDRLEITQNTTVELDTIISNSFNNVAVSSINGLVVGVNDFKTIEGSFNDIVTDNLFLGGNGIETITTSFSNADIGIELNLQNNELSTVDLSGIINVESLDISNNALTTVAFIDGIPGLEELDISSQFTFDNTAPTLTVIDGINNMITLETIIFDELAITSIDGFKDIGITSFDYDFTANQDVYIETITATSFSNNLITTLNFDNHDFDNVDFLDNFTVLTDLTISVDMADLSDFSGSVFETTLTDFTFTSVQAINDFTIFSGYDNVTALTLDSANTTTINNFNGMDALDTFDLVSIDSITTINNSFNSFDTYLLTLAYVSNYPNLTNINNSFDEYGREGLNTTVQLNGNVVIVDSFNNAIGVEIVNGLETSPNFDNLSFDSLENLTLTEPQYNSYAFMSNYDSLGTVEIHNLPKNITDLSHTTVDNLIISELDPTVTNLTYTISDTATLDLDSTSSNPITITSNNANFAFSIQNVNVTLDSTASGYSFVGSVGDLSINNNTATFINLSSFVAEDMILNTDLLEDVSSDSLSGIDASSVIVNSTVAVLSVDIRTDLLTINDNALNNVTIDNQVNSSSIYVNTIQTDVTSTIFGFSVYFNNDNLETYTLTAGSVDNLDIDSTNLQTVNTSTTTVSIATFNTSQPVVDFSGSSVAEVYANVSSVTNGTFDFSSSNISLQNMTGNVTLDLTANNVGFQNIGTLTGVTLTDTSSVNYLNLSGQNSISNLYVGNNSVNSVDLLTDVTDLNITGTGSILFAVDGVNVNTATLDVSSSDFTLNTDQATLTIDGSMNDLVIDNSSNLTTTTIDNASTVNEIVFSSTPLISTLAFGTANISSLEVESTVNTFNLTGTNTVNTQLTLDNIDSLQANVGTNDIEIDSIKTGTVSFEILANEAVLTVDPSILVIDTDSVVTDLTINDNSLVNLIMGSASVTNLDIVGSGDTLNISSLSISTLDINSGVTDLTTQIPLTAILDVTSTSSTGLVIDTDTSDVTVSATTDVDVTSSTLEAATLNISGNNATFDVTKALLSFNLSGNMNSALFNTSNVDNLTFGAGTTITDVTLTNTNISDIDVTNSTITNLYVNSNVSSFEVLGSSLALADITSTNLVSFSTGSNISSIIINNNVASFDIDGSANSLEINNNSLTAIDYADFDANSALFNANSLATLDTLLDVVTLEINTLAATFNLSTQSPNVTLNAGATSALNLSSTAATMVLNTDVDEVEFNGSTTEFNVDAVNLNTVSGNFDTLNLNDIDAGTLSIDSTDNVFGSNADAVNINDNVSIVLVLGNGYIDNILVDSETITLVSTNSAVISNLEVDSFNNTSNVSVDTLAEVIDLSWDHGETITVNARNNATINSYAPTVVINSSTLSDVIMNILGVNNTNTIETNTLGNFTLNYGTQTTLVLDIDADDFVLEAINSDFLQSVDIEGNVDNSTITAVLLDTLDTTSFFVDVNFTLVDTLIDDLTFVSIDLLGVVDVINVNTLDIANIDTIVTTMELTGITLTSPITSQNVFDYYYQGHYDTLRSDEDTNNTRYDAYYAVERNEALAVFRSSTYFDYVSNNDLYAEIDAQTYSSAADYLDGYAVSLGYADTQAMIDDTENYGQAAVEAIEADIQTILDNAELIIDTGAIDTQVEADIVAEATALATTDDTNKGFIIS